MRTRTTTYNDRVLAADMGRGLLCAERAAGDDAGCRERRATRLVPNPMCHLSCCCEVNLPAGRVVEKARSGLLDTRENCNKRHLISSAHPRHGRRHHVHRGGVAERGNWKSVHCCSWCGTVGEDAKNSPPATRPDASKPLRMPLLSIEVGRERWWWASRGTSRASLPSHVLKFKLCWSWSNSRQLPAACQPLDQSASTDYPSCRRRPRPDPPCLWLAWPGNGGAERRPSAEAQREGGAGLSPLEGGTAEKEEGGVIHT
jgi:hypothetical protein